MTIESTAQLISKIALFAGGAALRTLALAAVTGLAFRLARLRPAALRLTGWTGLLYAALAIPLLGFVVPSLRAPLLPSNRFGFTRLADKSDSPPARIETRTGMLDQSIAESRTASDRSIPAGDGVSPKSGMAALEWSGSDAAKAPTVGKTGIVAGAPAGGGCCFTAEAGAPTATASSSIPAASGMSTVWTALLLLGGLLYLAVSGFLLVRVLTGVVLGRRLQKEALPVVDLQIQNIVRQMSARARRRSSARERERARAIVAESTSISVPVTIGVLHPVVLLPSEWRDWDQRMLRAVLAHELSHVNRRDSLTQLLSAIHRSFFWFSPLPWWLHRRLVDLAEQASDDSALLVVEDRPFYAEVLLGFFESISAAPGRWIGVSMARGSRGSRAGQRVDRILAGTTASPAAATRAITAAILIATIPLAIAAASVTLVPRPNASDSASGQASAAQKKKRQSDKSAAQVASAAAAQTPGVQGGVAGGVSSGAEGGVAGGVPGGVPGGILDGVPGGVSGGIPDGVPDGAATILDGPVPSAVFALPSGDTPLAFTLSGAPDGPQVLAGPAIAASTLPPTMAMLAAIDSRPVLASTDQDSQDWKDNGQDSYVIMTGGMTIVMHGSKRDLDHAKSLRKKIKTDFIWFKHAGHSYVITDPATVKAAEDMFSVAQDDFRSGLAAHIGDQVGGYADFWKQHADGLRRQAEEMARAASEKSVEQGAEIQQQVEDILKKQAELMTQKSKAQADMLSAEAKRLQNETRSNCAEYIAALRELCELEEKMIAGVPQEERAGLQERIAELKSRVVELQKQGAYGFGDNLAKLQEKLRELGANMGAAQADMAKRQSEMARKYAERAAQYKMLRDKEMKEMQQSMQERMREVQKNFNRLRPFNDAGIKMRKMLDQALENGLATPEP